MIGKKFAAWVVGKVIRADDLDELRKALEWLLNLRASAPLEISETAAGPLFRFAGGDLLRDAVSTSAITARSGNTLGSGTAKYCFPGGTDEKTLTLTEDGEVTTYNITSGQIESGTFGYIMVVAGKPRWVVADCPGSGASPATPTP